VIVLEYGYESSQPRMLPVCRSLFMIFSISEEFTYSISFRNNYLILMDPSKEQETQSATRIC